MEENNNKKYNFYLKGTNGKALLLIHGITGTPSEMRYMGKAVHKAGYTVYCNTLPRHCDTLSELKKVTWQEIADACAQDMRFLTKDHDKVYVGGLSMGALLSVHLAYLYPGEVKGILALAPTVFYDGWALPKTKVLMDFLWHIPFIRNAMDIRETWPHGLKDEELRESVSRFYKNAKAGEFSKKVFLFGSPFFPMASLYQHHLLTQVVRKEIGRVKAPVLVMHAREDDMTSLKNAHYVHGAIGSDDKTLVILENSYHMITIDRDKDRVAQEAVKFMDRL